MTELFLQAPSTIIGGALVLVGFWGVFFAFLIAREPSGQRARGYQLLGLGSMILMIGGSIPVGVTFGRTFLGLKKQANLTVRLLQASYQTQSEQLIRTILNDESHRDPKKLSRHERKVFSQNGEDGLIYEIFRRIGTTNRHFVEFGASDGFENNTALLVRQGWSGLWIDASSNEVNAAREHYRPEVENGKLVILEDFITAENIEDLFRRGKVPEEFDLLSIDIDRNDYYVWEKISAYRPRVVAIEYNALYPPTMSWVIPYAPTASWDGTSKTGASLKALEELGNKKGYALVGCCLAGVNAFFVRQDLLGDYFAQPYTAENHYEPARYNLNGFDSNHPRVP